MNYKPIMLGTLIALAGSGAGLRAQGWMVTANSSPEQGYQFQNIPAMAIGTFDLPTGTLLNPFAVTASFSRPWHGDPVLEGYAASNTPVVLSLQTEAPGYEVIVPATPLSKWELKGKNGEFMTEKVEFAMTVTGLQVQ